MKIDLTCPIEIRGYELICDDRGCARAYITLSNLAPHAIARFDAIVCWANSQNGHSAAHPFRADRLEADARSEFRLSLSTESVPEADTLEIHFTRVHFADGHADWIGGQAEWVEISELPEISGVEKRMLHIAAGEDAVRFPEKHEKHWVCVCGRANFRHQHTCARCLRDRTDVLRNLNRNAVLSGKQPEEPSQRIEPKRPTAEDRINELRSRFQLFRRQRNILVRRTITMGVVVLMLLSISLISDYQQSVEEAKRGANPPTLSVRVVEP